MAMLLTAVAFMVAGCSSCQSGNKEQGQKTKDTVLTASVEDIIATSRQTMYGIAAGNDYRYFETNVKLVEFLDSEAQNGDFVEVTNVFQLIIPKDKGYDTKVWIIGVNLDGKIEKQYEGAFYLENFPLNDEKIDLTFKEALERLQQANVVKPHSQFAVLRKPVGPVPCNTQWIFGNSKQTVFVDAVTGDVRTSNPAFYNYHDEPIAVKP